MNDERNDAARDDDPTRPIDWPAVWARSRKRARPGSLARRAFLGGLGVAVGLPYLESLAGRNDAFAQTPPAPKQRFLTIFLPDGVLVDEWVPTATGATFTMPPLLVPLAKFQVPRSLTGFPPLHVSVLLIRTVYLSPLSSVSVT